jgi:putative hydrolase of the HAD superfamily
MTRHNKPQAVIFDFDNTLEYWQKASRKAEKNLIKRIAKECKIKESILKSTFLKNKHRFLIEGKTPAMFSHAFWLKKTLEELNLYLSLRRIHHHTEKFWQEVEDNVRLYAGALELLDFLKKNKIKLGLISDSDGLKKYKYNRIKRLGIKRFFDVILTSDDVGHNKPHPAIFKRTLKELRAKPDKTWMVGDNPRNDCYGAKLLGINTICVLRGSWKKYFSQPRLKREYSKYLDYEFDDLREVLSFFRKKLSKKPLI